MNACIGERVTLALGYRIDRSNTSCVFAGPTKAAIDLIVTEARTPDPELGGDEKGGQRQAGRR